MFSKSRIALCAAAAIVIAGCASTAENGRVDESKETIAAPPGWVLGTPAEGRTEVDPDDPGLMSSLFGVKSEKEQLAAQEQRIAQLERQLQRQALQQTEASAPRTASRAAPTQAPSGVQPQIGLYMRPDVAQSRYAGPLAGAVAGVAPDYPLALVGQAELEQQLAQAGCDLANPTPCAESLAIFPGVRILTVIDAVEATEDDLLVRAHNVDAELGFSYPAMTVRIPLVDGQAPRPALEGLGDKLLLTALDRAQLAPWFTHAFTSEGEKYFLSAGRSSGLEVGDRLEVHAPGRVIRAPSGAPATWLPGAQKGVLEVQSLPGNDVAIAVLVEGQPPSPKDPVTKVR